MTGESPDAFYKMACPWLMDWIQSSLFKLLFLKTPQKPRAQTEEIQKQLIRNPSKAKMGVIPCAFLIYPPFTVMRLCPEVEHLTLGLN
jgi:hypothetical protein